jgi:hypothetical protein
VSNDRAVHVAYRQQRIIDARNAILARERAVSEELLERELSPQVAAPSREPVAALAARTPSRAWTGA